MTSAIVRRYLNFNVRCLSAISGRTFTAERTEPTFDIMAWIHWRRARWLGKALRGDKGNLVLNAVHWGFQHQEHGDVFHDLPPAMKTSSIPCVTTRTTKRPGPTTAKESSRQSGLGTTIMVRFEDAGLNVWRTDQMKGLGGERI